MALEKPKFLPGDKVQVRFPKNVGRWGTVTNIYKSEDDYRYVIVFDDGHEVVIYEKDLVSFSEELP